MVGILCWPDGDPHEEARIVAEVIRALNQGGVSLVPTDTVYGLLCMPTSPGAVERVFTMKQRPTNSRLPIIVADLAHAKASLPMVWNEASIALANAFWPGALTIAIGVSPLAGEWLEGRDEAAIRAPAHALVRSVAEALGPLLMTSANIHGHETPHSMKGALSELVHEPTIAVDGGTLTGAPSTLVNVNLPSPTIEREGAVPAAEVERVLGDVEAGRSSGDRDIV